MGSNGRECTRPAKGSFTRVLRRGRLWVLPGSCGVVLHVFRSFSMRSVASIALSATRALPPTRSWGHKSLCPHGAVVTHTTQPEGRTGGAFEAPLRIASGRVAMDPGHSDQTTPRPRPPRTTPSKAPPGLPAGLPRRALPLHVPRRTRDLLSRSLAAARSGSLGGASLWPGSLVLGALHSTGAQCRSTP